MVDVREELFDVAFQHPTRASVVLGHLIGELLEAVHCFVCSLPYAAGVGVGDECCIEEWVENAIYGVVQEAVADTCLVDVAGFWVGNAKVMVGAVAVGFAFEVAVERENVPHQVALKFLHIWLTSLSAQKLFPRQK